MNDAFHVAGGLVRQFQYYSIFPDNVGAWGGGVQRGQRQVPDRRSLLTRTVGDSHLDPVEKLWPPPRVQQLKAEP